ncbi:MAG: diacylglycerol kinase family protein [Lachnospiraceae bacterium]|nr:diacylglycerol kinase family protein [Lachnospiraceae bacterium]
MKQYILFNPKAGGGTRRDQLENEPALKAEGFENAFVDLTGIGSYKDFFAGLSAEDRVVICGGDGTLHRFVNDTEGIDIKPAVYCYAAGTGNDFLNDVKDREKGLPVYFTPYMKDLPKVTVNGKTERFINNVGFGLDGYCCEIGDAQREKGVLKVNYTAIALKGLLGGYKRATATIEADGVKKTYKNVWLAPTMNGRFCGGGMMLAPDQDRLNPEHTVSLMVMHCRNKLKTLLVFPTVFKGKHVLHKDMVEGFKAKKVHVVFDTPTAIQIDGETTKNVTEYFVETA